MAVAGVVFISHRKEMNSTLAVVVDQWEVRRCCLLPTMCIGALESVDFPVASAVVGVARLLVVRQMNLLPPDHVSRSHDLCCALRVME